MTNNVGSRRRKQVTFIKPPWAEKIFHRRRELNKSQEKVAADSGDVIYQTTVSRIERGIIHPVKNLSIEELYGLLRGLEWTPEEFTSATGLEIPGVEPLEMMGARPVTSTMKVPILGTVSAGRGETTVELEGELEVPEEVLRRYRSYNLFALRVTGDSMYCEDLPISIPPGAYVVAAADLAAQPGDVVVAWHEPSQTGFLKEWHPKRGHQVLRSWNPDVPPILIQPDDPIDIQGVVVNVTFNPRQIKKERKGGRR